MPASHSLAQHEALTQLQTQLEDGEVAFAFLDDTYIIVPPERIRPLYDALACALWEHACVRLHEARFWNAAGEEPPGIAPMTGRYPPSTEGSRSSVRRRAAPVQTGRPQKAPAACPFPKTCKPLGCCCTLALLLGQTTCCEPHLTASFAQAHDVAIARCVGLLVRYTSRDQPPGCSRS